MTLKTGDKAPAFTLQDQDGTTRSLTTMLVDGPVVLFFYPIASSGGCTKESCHFRDLAGEFAAAGAQRVGISPDTVEKQKAFSDANRFDYPLLADVGGTVAEQFGVKRGGLLGKLGPVKRVTFVIGTDGLVSDVITGEMKFDQHADSALAALKK